MLYEVITIGEETDVVGKEMYTFTDKGGSSLTLRPEMTASVIRSFIQHSMGEQTSLNKLYYIGPMFRQERPQAGRFRQFHQYGFESIGQQGPECDRITSYNVCYTKFLRTGESRFPARKRRGR